MNAPSQGNAGKLRADRADFRFFHPLRVRWAEVDGQQVVFNVNYYLYFDVTVTEYWRAVGFLEPLDMAGTHASELYVVKSAAEFHGSARYDEVMDIGCRAAALGRSSLRMAFGIWVGERPVASGEIVYVNVDARTRKGAPLQEAMTTRILAYEKTPPEMQ
jgi:acyl-CoA thioester hydrolase